MRIKLAAAAALVTGAWLGLVAPHAHAAGTLSVTPSSIAFGSVPVGSSVTGSATVQNTGDVDVFFNGESMVAPGFGLALGSDTCFAHTLHPGDSCTAAVQFTPTALASYSGTFVLFSDVGVPNPLSIPVSGTGAPNLTVTPASIGFGSVPVGSSVTGSVTVQNVGSTDIFFNGESMVAPGFGLALGSDTCFAHTLHPGDSCTAAVQFTPTALASYSGTFVLFSDVGAPNPLSIPVSGTGAPNLTVTPTSFDFGSHPISSRNDAVVSTVQNVGSTDVFFNGEFGSGGDFFLSPLDTCFAHTLHPGDTCQLAAQFVPSALGTRNGSIGLTSTGGAPSPLVVPLTGVGTPNLVPSPASVDFGDVVIGTFSAVRHVTLQNLGTTTVSFDSFSVTPPFVLAANGCGASLAGGASCDISLQFHPDALGTRLGTLHVGSNAAGGPVDVPLTGVGVTAPATASLSATGHDFGSLGIGTSSAPWVLLVTDNGPGSILVSAVTLAGANPGDFAILSDSCSGVTLSQGGSCALSLAFQPTVAGSRTANVVVTHNGANSPLSAGLSGVGVASTVTLSTNELDFKNTKVGDTSTAKTLTLTNDGPGTLDVSGVTIGGAAAGDYLITANTCTGAHLAPHASCSVSVAFKPTATGTRLATLTIADNAAAAPQSVALVGKGVGKKG